jgi:hypothetical protein
MHDWLVAHYNVLKDFAGPVVALLSLCVTIIIAIFGFSTFGRWKREQLEGRRIDIAFSALDLAYKTGHVFDHIRGPLIEDYEWADMPEVAGDTEHKRRRRGGWTVC